MSGRVNQPECGADTDVASALTKLLFLKIKVLQYMKLCRLVNVYLVSQKFCTAISKGLGCVDPSSMIFHDVSNYLPVNTSPYTTSARL
jgi:hypothetical protein